MKIDYRSIVRPGESEALGALLKNCFPVPQGASFFDDFPVWAESSEGTYRLGAFAEKSLVSSSACRMVKMKTPGNELSVAMIGAVATHGDYRGKGLASALVQKNIDWAEKSGAAAVFLWGAEHEMYQKLGFELCGFQAKVPLARLNFSPSQLKVGMGWNESLMKRLKNRELGVELGPRSGSLFRAHRNVQWYWVGEASEPLAYAAVGRGIDLPGMVHEWGGDPEALRGLLGFLKTKIDNGYILGLPYLLEKLGISDTVFELEYLCMARILDPKKVFNAFYPNDGFECIVEADRCRMHMGGKPFAEIKRSMLPLLFFGPAELKEFDQENQWFPLPLWFWGLDAS